MRHVMRVGFRSGVLEIEIGHLSRNTGCCVTVATHTQSPPPPHLCSIYERALAYNGTDYQSHPLWEKYIAFEGEAGTPLHVAALYTRALACPLKEVARILSK